MLEGLRSSPRKLARVFHKGREAWKERAQEQQQRAKKLDGKVCDLTRSRDRWKAEAKKLKQQLRELQAAVPPVSAPNAPPDGSDELATTPTAHRGPGAAPPFCQLPNDRTSRSI